MIQASTNECFNVKQLFLAFWAFTDLSLDDNNQHTHRSCPSMINQLYNWVPHHDNLTPNGLLQGNYLWHRLQMFIGYKCAMCIPKTKIMLRQISRCQGLLYSRLPITSARIRVFHQVDWTPRVSHVLCRIPPLVQSAKINSSLGKDMMGRQQTCYSQTLKHSELIAIQVRIICVILCRLLTELFHKTSKCQISSMAVNSPYG